VYSSAPRQLPLTLATSKSWVGHAEPAAGLAGLLFARTAVTHALALPLMHLRAINPHVGNALEQQPRSGGVAAALLPRQGGAGPLADGSATWGVSAFAFQGTNAHAVVAAAGPATDAAAAAGAAAQLVPCTWQPKRHYILPESHLLICTAAVLSMPADGAAQRRVQYHAELAGASLAYLWDHQVLGKAVFPGELSR
jgi:acyl transferase domain-containing protein